MSAVLGPAKILLTSLCRGAKLKEGICTSQPMRLFFKKKSKKQKRNSLNKFI